MDMKILANPRVALILLLAAIFGAYIGESIYGTVFNNYFNDVQRIGTDARGFLEFPRELPGVLSVFAVGALFFLKEIHIASVAALLLGIGIAAMALPAVTDNYAIVLLLVALASLGQHIMMVVVDAIVLHTSSPENRSIQLGQMRSLITLAGLAGAGLVCLNSSFTFSFLIAGGFCVAAAVLFLFVRDDRFPEHKSLKERLVVRKKYSKYYWLEVFFGARKQVFITFGLWVMVYLLEKDTAYVAKLFLITNIIGVVFKPMVGKLIKSYGERRILVFDSICLFFVCLGYAFSLQIFSLPLATAVITCCFVLDNLLFAFGAARSTFLARIVDNKEELTPSLYTGMAINHVFSISAALVGGHIWTYSGSHVWVFLLAALLAICSGFVASGIPEAGIPAKMPEVLPDEE